VGREKQDAAVVLTGQERQLNDDPTRKRISSARLGAQHDADRMGLQGTGPSCPSPRPHQLHHLLRISHMENILAPDAAYGEAVAGGVVNTQPDARGRRG
jgi:hypothetical protein